VFKPNLVQIQKLVYRTSAWSIFTYGSEAWTVCKQSERFRAAEIKYENASCSGL